MTAGQRIATIHKRIQTDSNAKGQQEPTQEFHDVPPRLKVMDFGTGLYVIYLFLLAALLYRLLARGYTQPYPVFSVYIAFCLVRSAVLFMLYESSYWNAYGYIWNYGRGIGATLLVAAAMEAVGRMYKIEDYAPVVSFGAAFPAIWFQVSPSVALNQALHIMVCGLLLLGLPKVGQASPQTRAIITGVFTMEFLCGAGEIGKSFGLGWTAFIPTISFLAFLAICLPAFRFRAETVRNT